MAKQIQNDRAAIIDTPLFAQAPIKVVEAGSHLFHQGDEVTALFFIEEGRLRLERTTAEGTVIVLHDARAGELFAEAALFSDTYHCNAVALKRSRVRVGDKARVLAGFKQDESARALVAFMAGQLQRLRGRLELRNIRSAQERLLLFLESQANAAGEVILHGELQQIAEELGLTREALYRALSALSAEGRIKRPPGRIVLHRSGL
jgi:CRP/FNR family transcriptional regulator, dissimilatory nitrate respiration regulator